jgi:ribose transport system substrate-binding protein
MSTPSIQVQSVSAVGPRQSVARNGRRSAAALALTCVLSLLAACGQSSTESQGGSSVAVVKEAESALAKNREGTDRTMPTSAPLPQPGENVWIISCGQSNDGCSRPAAGAEEAGKSIGWDMTLFDGQNSPDVFASGIRSAIADDADAIILLGVDCVAAKTALQEAHDAGVKIFGALSLDCDDPLAAAGEPLFDAVVQYEKGMSYAAYTEDQYARSTADYVIAETGGDAKIIAFTQGDSVIAQHLVNGFMKRVKECATCTIVGEVPITFADLVSGKLQSKAAAALIRYPQANVVYAPYDTALILGVSQAVVASGRKDDLLVPGCEGLSANIGFIRDNKGQDSITGSPGNWVGWAAVDGLNRALQGEPQVDEGIGFQTLDATGPLPEQTTYYDGNIDADGNPKQDYKAQYRKIWSGS